MSLQNFVPRNLPTITAAWLNAVDRQVTQLLTSVGVDSGVAGAAVVTLSASLPEFIRTTGTQVAFIPIAVNTGAATLNVQGTGVAAIINQAGNALTGGELSKPLTVRWTGAAWQIVAGSIPTVNARTTAETTAGVMPTNFDIPSHTVGPFIPDRYGTVDRTGAVSCRVPIQTAITVARAINTAGRSGGDIDLSMPGNYLIDGVAADSKLTGILIPYSADEIEGGGVHKRIRLLCTTETNLLAGSNNMIVIRCSDSLSQITGFPTIRGNGFTTVWGVGVVPEDMAQTTTAVFQTYNHIEVIVRSCAEGIVLMGGPNVAGRDSGCWLNTIEIYAYSCTRGIWLKNATTTSSLVNTRNWIKGRVGQTGTNTGCQIDAGSENQLDVHFEGILTGVTPNNPPVAVVIATAPPAGGENTNNRLWGSFEACTNHINCAQDDTWVITDTLDESLCVFSQRPKMIITRQTAGAGDTLVEASEVRAAQRLSVTGSDAPVVLNDSRNASRFSLIHSNAGAGANFNGVQLASNTKADLTQGNAALSSWRSDVGGYDATAIAQSGDAFSVDRRPAGGAWAPMFRVRNDGIRRYFGPTTAAAGAAGGGTALPATPVGYFQIDIGNVVYKVPYYNF